MYKYIRDGLCFLAITALAGCSADLQPDKHILDDGDLFWSLKLNHRAINLSTTAPYDTATLDVKGYTADGNEIVGLTDITLQSQGDNVVVFPDGKIKGLSQTSASGVFIIARATVNGITLEDTARVVVTNVESPPMFKEINPTLNDHRTYVDGVHILDITPSFIMPNVVDSSGNPIPRAILKYTASSGSRSGLYFADSWRASFEPGVKGTYLVDIEGYIYGIKVSGSLSVKVMDRRIAIHAVAPGNGIPRESYISLGGGVYWVNTTDDSLDIEFEDPTKASQACCTLVGMALAGDSGNIKPFQRDMSKPVMPPGCFICIPRMDPDIAQGRSFHIPGRYKYISRKNPNVWGTVIVSDPYSN